MREPTQDLAEILPAPAPACANSRLLLYAMRRVATAGLNDAHATNAFLTAFGRSFRRPLVLLRALMAEVSRVSNAKLPIAPCCCPRLTEAESVLLAAVIDANRAPRDAHRRLCGIMQVNDCLGALSSAQALALAFEDCGRPLHA